MTTNARPFPDEHAHAMTAPAPVPAPAGQGAEHRQRRSRQRASQQPRIRGRYASALYSGDSWRPIFRVT